MGFPRLDYPIEPHHRKLMGHTDQERKLHALAPPPVKGNAGHLRVLPHPDNNANTAATQSPYPPANLQAAAKSRR